MFGSDRGRGKYVSVCDILCIVCKVGKSLERVLEDAATCLTLPMHTVCSASHMMEGTLKYIYIWGAQTSYTQLLCFGPKLNSWNRSRRMIKAKCISGVTVPPRTHTPLKKAIVIKSLSFASLLCHCIMFFK